MDYMQVLRFCMIMDVTLDVITCYVIFACKFFSDVTLNLILYHAWRESALRAPKISHELYIYMYDIHHIQILHGCDPNTVRICHDATTTFIRDSTL